MDQLIGQKALKLQAVLWLEMLLDTCMKNPEEACGLVAGKDMEAREVYRTTNEYHSPTRYRMDPQEQVASFIDMDQQGWDLIAIYHSHPTGPIFPSQTDLDEFAYPDVLTLIWSKEKDIWLCKAYNISEGRYDEVPIILEA